MQHDSFLCVTQLTHVCDTTHCIEEEGRGDYFQITDRFACVTCRIAFLCVTRLIHMCDMTHYKEGGEKKRFQMDDMRGGGLGSSTIFKKFNEPYAPS